jgi:hypothetical protein
MGPFKLFHESETMIDIFRIETWEQRYPALSAGFTTRHGGVSGGAYATLNCALHIPDDPDCVAENRRRLARTLNVPFESWTCGEQVHGNRVAVVTSRDKGRGRLAHEDAISGVDALITNEEGIWLTSFYADCAPVYLFDPETPAVGLAHAGWKGTVTFVVREAVEAMKQTYGSRPERMLAAIGPSIGACCYEVGHPVIDRVRDCMDELGIGRAERERVLRPAQSPEKNKLDLQELNRQIMIKAGILPVHIEICGMCTSCRTDLFFSHRKENGSTGRMVSWIGLNLQESGA